MDKAESLLKYETDNHKNLNKKTIPKPVNTYSPLMKHETAQKHRQMGLRKLLKKAIILDPQVKNKSKKIYEIMTCGAIHQYFVDRTNKHKHEYMGYYCHERLCPICCRRKAFKNRLKLKTILKYLNHHYRYDNGNPRYLTIFCTFTIPDVPDNAKAIKHSYKKLHRNIRIMLKTKRYNGFTKHNPKGIIKGGIIKTEITFNNKKDKFHPHLHALLLVRRSYFTSRYYIKHSIWQNNWEKVNNWNAKEQGHHLQIRIERPFYKDKYGKKHKIVNTKNKKIMKGAERKMIDEISGYETKSDDILGTMSTPQNSQNDSDDTFATSSNAFLSLYFGTKHQSAYQYFGLLRKINKMYNNKKLELFKPTDTHVYKLNMKTKYNTESQNYDESLAKMNLSDIREARSKGLLTALSNNEQTVFNKIVNEAKTPEMKKKYINPETYQLVNAMKKLGYQTLIGNKTEINDGHFTINEELKMADYVPTKSQLEKIRIESIRNIHISYGESNASL